MKILIGALLDCNSDLDDTGILFNGVYTVKNVLTKGV